MGLIMIHHDWSMSAKDFLINVSEPKIKHHQNAWYSTDYDVVLIFHNMAYVWNIPRDQNDKPKHSGEDYLKVVQNYFAQVLKLSSNP